MPKYIQNVEPVELLEESKCTCSAVPEVRKKCELCKGTGKIPPLKYTLAQAVVYVLDTAPEYASSGTMIRASARIACAVENAEPLAWFEVKDEDYTRFAPVFEEAKAYGQFTRHVRDDTGKVIGLQEARIPPRKFLRLINAVSEAVNQLPTKLRSVDGEAEKPPTASAAKKGRK